MIRILGKALLYIIIVFLCFLWTVACLTFIFGTHVVLGFLIFCCNNSRYHSTDELPFLGKGIALTKDCVISGCTWLWHFTVDTANPDEERQLPQQGLPQPQEAPPPYPGPPQFDPNVVAPLNPQAAHQPLLHPNQNPLMYGPLYPPIPITRQHGTPQGQGNPNMYPSSPLHFYPVSNQHFLPYGPPYPDFYYRVAPSQAPHSFPVQDAHAISRHPSTAATQASPQPRPQLAPIQIPAQAHPAPTQQPPHETNQNPIVRLSQADQSLIQPLPPAHHSPASTTSALISLL